MLVFRGISARSRRAQARRTKTSAMMLGHHLLLKTSVYVTIATWDSVALFVKYLCAKVKLEPISATQAASQKSIAKGSAHAPVLMALVAPIARLRRAQDTLMSPSVMPAAVPTSSVLNASVRIATLDTMENFVKRDPAT